MAQCVFPQDPADAYTKIRQQLDKRYGKGERKLGYERSDQFEFVWKTPDGVSIHFRRRGGESKARLTYSVTKRARAWLAK